MSPSLLVNGRFLSRPVTGVERFAIELTHALRALTVEFGPDAPKLRLALPGRGGRDPAQLERDGWPTGLASRLGRMAGQIWEQFDLARVDRRIWILNLCNLGPVARARQALVIHDAQIYLHPESYSRAFRWWYRMLLPRLGRRARVVLTVSDFSRRQIEHFAIAPVGKVRVVRSGVDHIEQITPESDILDRGGLKKHRYILAIGSLAAHKNLATLVDAFMNARIDGVDLIVAGGGNARVFTTAGLPRADNVRYLGRVTDGELKALYLNALAFACPSYTEGFGLTPLEAMACGCPVIVTTGGAVPEVCGDAGLYVDPGDRDGWRDAIRRVIDDDALRHDLSVRGRRRAATFTWRGAALDLLESIAMSDDDHGLLRRLKELRERGEVARSVPG